MLPSVSPNSSSSSWGVRISCVQQQVFEVGAVICNLIDNSLSELIALFVRPAALGFYRAVLHENGHHVFAGWRERGVILRRNQRVAVGVCRPAIVLPVVVGFLETPQCIGEMHVTER